MKKYFQGLLLSLFFSGAGFSAAFSQSVLRDLRIAKMSVPPPPGNRSLKLRSAKIEAIAQIHYIPQSCFVFGSTTCTLLPVHLLDFNATRVNDKTAALSWRTENESALLGYYIERAENNASFFSNRGFSAAHAYGATINEYRFDDPNDLTVTSYYRLRIAHADGSFTFSDVKPVKPVKENLALLLYPNPAYGTINLRVTVSRNTSAQFVITDAAGRKVKEWTGKLTTGTSTITEDISQLSGGSYFVTILTAEDVKMVGTFFKGK